MPPAEILTFHRSLPGYAATPVRDLGDDVFLKDESARLGLPAFKILGASWAAHRAIGADTTHLVAASAGNHGRAVARVANWRKLACRIYLPERALPARRAAIESEGAEVVIVDGTYEDAVRMARAACREPGVVEIADVGDSAAAHDVIDGYSTLFAELDELYDTVIVPVGVGSLAAAAARYGEQTATEVIGVEPRTAACLTAALAAGEPVTIETPGTTMAGMDCARVSEAAWPDLAEGISDTVLVGDEEVAAAMVALAARGIHVGECGAAAYAALAHLDGTGRTLLLATEGPLEGDAVPAPRPMGTVAPVAGRLDELDLSLKLSKKEEEERLVTASRKLLALRLHLGGKLASDEIGPPVCVLFEGWDASGKGGAIKRLVAPMDPRHIRVAQFAAPTHDEKRHHFLWRFFPVLPGWGGMAVLDRTWYGRVLVERVEGYASVEQWSRAYDEIVEFERMLAREGMILIKFWLHVSPEEQLKRFKSREKDSLKRWKLTDEDWRNRERRDAYEQAVEDMVARTSHELGRWTLVEGDSKRHARVKVVESVIEQTVAGMRERGFPLPDGYGD